MLSKEVLIERVGAAVANANNTDQNSTILDMEGWEGVVFMVTVTDSVQGGVATLKAEGNTANSDAGMAAYTGASAAKTSAGNDDLNDKTLILDVYRPSKRYIQAVITSATQNIAFGETWAIRYRGRVAPITASSGTLTHTAVVSPAS
jgi:hypothetical protein